MAIENSGCATTTTTDCAQECLTSFAILAGVAFASSCVLSSLASEMLNVKTCPMQRRSADTPGPLATSPCAVIGNHTLRVILYLPRVRVDFDNPLRDINQN